MRVERHVFVFCVLIIDCKQRNSMHCSTHISFHPHRSPQTRRSPFFAQTLLCSTTLMLVMLKAKHWILCSFIVAIVRCLHFRMQCIITFNWRLTESKIKTKTNIQFTIFLSQLHWMMMHDFLAISAWKMNSISIEYDNMCEYGLQRSCVCSFRL